MNADPPPYDFRATYVGGYPPFAVNHLNVIIRLQITGITLMARGKSLFLYSWRAAEIYFVSYTETNCLYAAECRGRVTSVDRDLWEASREGGEEFLPCASLIVGSPGAIGGGTFDVRLAFKSQNQAEGFIEKVSRMLGVGPI